jgi:hypothetical protein
MALSQADFYAYSRATGAPVPEDPEERAQMAPSVAEFRRNQLKAPEQGQQQGQNALATLAGIGAMALAGVGAYRLAKGRLPKGAPASATAPVQTVDIARKAESAGAVSRAAQETPRPSTPPTQQIEETLTEIREEPIPQFTPRQYIEATGSVEQIAPVSSRSLMATDEEAMQQYSRQLAQDFPEPTQSEMQALESPSRYGKILSRLGTVPAYRPDPKDINYARFGPVSPEVAAARREQATENLLQFARQRQEDAALVSNQTMGALESGEDQVTGRIKNQLQRNEDLDLTQVEALENTQGNIQVVASQLPDGVPVDQTLTPQRLSSQELADVAKQEMMAQRQALMERGLRPGTQRFENALAQTWTSKAGTRPGTEEFQESISLPTPIRAAVDVVEELEEDALPMRTQRSVPNVGPYAEVTQTAAGTAIRGASPSYYEAAPKQELRQLSPNPSPLVRNVPEQLGLDLPGALRVRGGVQPQAEPGQLSKQEIKYSVLDRPAQEELAGGSAGIGIYGEETGYVPGAMSKATGEYSAASSRQPSYVPKWIAKQEQTPFSGVSTEGLLRAQEKSGKSGQTAIEQELGRRQRALESIAVSETLRRANIEGRNPQEFLRRQLRGGI